MADPEHLAKLLEGVGAWNEWREKSPESKVDLREAILANSNLHGANLSGADLREARLAGTNMSGASLSWANLSKASLRSANLHMADLRNAILHQTDLSGAHLGESYLIDADLREANLVEANLIKSELGMSNLQAAHLRGADLRKAVLIEANLRDADLAEANLREADLGGVILFGATLAEANLSETNLKWADLRNSNLQYAKLDKCSATGIMLWETQRAGWSIKGIICERAYWDKDAEEPTIYDLREFERLHSDQACFELHYKGGVSSFELSTLPALLHYLASMHPDTDIRLKSIEATGGGAKISISVGDADPETVSRIKDDAQQAVKAQLALRESELLKQLKLEMSAQSERIIKAVFEHKMVQQNIFHGPVYTALLPSGNSTAHSRQIVNDNSALLVLLEKMMDRRRDLGLADASAGMLKSELQSATAELQKEDLDKSVLSKSLEFIQKLVAEAATKAAGKLGEQAVSADWHTWLHQLSQFISNLKPY